jgi:hypothetical protein
MPATAPMAQMTGMHKLSRTVCARFRLVSSRLTLRSVVALIREKTNVAWEGCCAQCGRTSSLAIIYRELVRSFAARRSLEIDGSRTSLQSNTRHASVRHIDTVSRQLSRCATPRPTANCCIRNIGALEIPSKPMEKMLNVFRGIEQEAPVCRLRSAVFVEASWLLWSCNSMAILWRSGFFGNEYLCLGGRVNYLMCL